jgi:hypothetical protein
MQNKILNFYIESWIDLTFNPSFITRKIPIKYHLTQGNGGHNFIGFEKYWYIKYWSNLYNEIKNGVFKNWEAKAWDSSSVRTNFPKLEKIPWMDYDKLYTEKEKFEWYKQAIEKEWLSDYFYFNERWTIWIKSILKTIYFRFDFTRTEKSKINDLYSTDLIVGWWRAGVKYDLWKTTWSLTTVLGFFSQR